MDASASVGVGIKDQLVLVTHADKSHEPPSTLDTKSSTLTKSLPSERSSAPAKLHHSTKKIAAQSDTKRAISSKVDDEDEDNEVVCLGTVPVDETRKKKLQ